MYRSLGRSAVEFLWLAARGEDAVAHVSVDPASAALWLDAESKKRGVVVAASHTGNWDLAACAIAKKVELLVVTKHVGLASLDAFWQSTRRAQGVNLWPASGVMAEARRVLVRGGAVAMMIDQVPSFSSHAVLTPFLGREAFVDRAPAALAARAGAPLVVAAGRRNACGEHVLHVLAVLVPPPRPGRAWVDAATVASTQALERFVRAHPSQWLWLHRRWRRPFADRVDRPRRAATLVSPCKTRSSSPAGRSRVA